MSDIAGTTIIIVVLIVSAPAWLPMFFILGGSILAAFIFIAVMIFVVLTDIYDGICALIRKAARKIAS